MGPVSPAIFATVDGEPVLVATVHEPAYRVTPNPQDQFDEGIRQAGDLGANGWLLAAAPDLLAALKKMMAAANCHYDPVVALAEYGAIAEAAIAKAEGGAA
jgi:hypothetical protein